MNVTIPKPWSLSKSFGPRQPRLRAQTSLGRPAVTVATGDKVALVTGASRGIGAATSKLLALEHGRLRELSISKYHAMVSCVRDPGTILMSLEPFEIRYTVVVNCRSDVARSEAVVEDIISAGGRAMSIVADVSNELEVEEMFAKIDTDLGPLSALVNNAGVLGRTLLADVTMLDIQQTLNTNVVGPILCSREAVKRMSTAMGGAGGAIVNVSSGSAYIGTPSSILYSVSKGALNSLSVGLTASYTKEGIRVNTVSPGMTNTELVSDESIQRAMSTIPMGRAGEPAEIAEVIAWLLSDKASYVSGANIRVAGGRP